MFHQEEKAPTLETLLVGLLTQRSISTYHPHPTNRNAPPRLEPMCYPIKRSKIYLLNSSNYRRPFILLIHIRKEKVDYYSKE